MENNEMETDIQQGVSSNQESSPIETMMLQMMKQMTELMARVQKVETNGGAISEQSTSAPEPTPAATESTLPTTRMREVKGLKDPELFDGTRSQYLPWKYQIEAKLRSEPGRFHTNRLAIDYTFSRTTGNARTRIFPWVSVHSASGTLEQFFLHLDGAFKDAHMAETARNKLQSMRQKSSNVRDFMQDFNKEALTAGLSDHAILKSMFLNALSHELRAALAGTIFSEDTTIEQMQSHIAAVSDNLWRLKLSSRKRENDKSPYPTTEARFSSPPPEPMDWEPSRSHTQRAKWVSQQELDRRREDGLCLRCGKKGHLIGSCRLKPAYNPISQPTRSLRARDKPKEVKMVNNSTTAIESDDESEKE